LEEEGEKNEICKNNIGVPRYSDACAGTAMAFLDLKI
jgi:hypothetical protein